MENLESLKRIGLESDFELNFDLMMSLKSVMSERRRRNNKLRELRR
ncbi:hypothetical protein KKG71_06300 [Patescibacteria group bacterium]|nr:hypothetical protein [Patescibacteria group bacterium]